MTALVAADVTITVEERNIAHKKRRNRVKIAFGDGALTYPASGVPLPTFASFGMVRNIDYLTVFDENDAVGILWKYDKDNHKLRAWRSAGFTPAGTAGAQTFTGTANAGISGTIDDNDNAATLGHALYVVPAAAAQFVPPTLATEAAATGLVKDSDTAATEGVALYVVVDDPNWSGTYQLGHFEFVSPTNANGTCTIANGADTLTLFDDDAAATNGVAVRAVAAGAGLEATTAAAKDILVPTSTGKYIHVNHATTGSTPELYFDEDAANTYERIRGVIVDNLDEPYKLLVDTAAAENAGVALSQGSIGRLGNIITVGPKPFTYLVGASGPEVTIASRPDAASLPGAVALYVQAAGAGFNAANFGKEDMFVPTAGGDFIKVAYAASPAGVQVYGYPEGATGDLKILGVIVDNADETFTTEAAVGWKRDTPAGTNSTSTLTGTAVSAAALVEDTGSALAAQVLYAEAVGW